MIRFALVFSFLVHTSGCMSHADQIPGDEASAMPSSEWVNTVAANVGIVSAPKSSECRDMPAESIEKAKVISLADFPVFPGESVVITGCGTETAMMSVGVVSGGQESRNLEKRLGKLGELTKITRKGFEEPKSRDLVGAWTRQVDEYVAYNETTQRTLMIRQAESGTVFFMAYSSAPDTYSSDDEKKWFEGVNFDGLDDH